MAVTDEEITKIVTAIRPVIREEVQASETRLRKEFKRDIKTQRQELEAYIERTNKAQTEEITGYIADIIESLDDAFASKETEAKVEQIITHLHATPGMS